MSISSKKRLEQSHGSKPIRTAVRADGGAGIGLGHIMRCLALALELKQLGHDVVFISVEDRQVEQLIIEHDFPVIPLPANHDFSRDLEVTGEIIQNSGISIVITDSYKISQEYLKELKKKAELLVSIDDLNLWPWPSDIVINGNLYANDLDYKSSNGNTRFLLGSQYTLLRREFCNVPERKARQKIEQILVTVGGSDILNLTPMILRSLCAVPGEFRITTVIGPSFENLEEIRSAAQGLQGKEVVFKTGVNKMRELMSDCDLAISSGGSTLYELAATGTPAVVLLQADNQVMVAEKMARERAVLNLGMGDQVAGKQISEAVLALNSSEAREAMAVIGQRLIDGLGASRCAQVITEHYIKRISD